MFHYQYDVFLSHSSIDKLAVEELAQLLVKIGIRPWLDEWNLIPGEPWQEAIEEALNDCATCAVFIGPSGTGPWQNVVRFQESADGSVYADLTTVAAKQETVEIRWRYSSAKDDLFWAVDDVEIYARLDKSSSDDDGCAFTSGRGSALALALLMVLTAAALYRMRTR